MYFINRVGILNEIILDQSLPVDSIKHLFTIWSLIEVSAVITVVTVSNAVYVILIGGHCCAATEKGRCLHPCHHLTSTNPIFMMQSLLLTCVVGFSYLL